MKTLNRRTFFGVAGSGVVGAMVAANTRIARAIPATTYGNAAEIEKQRQHTEIYLRSLYRHKNNLELDEFLSNFAEDVVYQDMTLGLSIPGLKNITPLFTNLFKAVGTPGRFSEFVHAAGDLQFGTVAEFVDLPKGFANTAYDALSILEMKDGKIVRNTDYWDSAQLGESDIFGPANKTGIAFPAVPVHPDGPTKPHAAAAFVTGKHNQGHASPEFVDVVTRFQKAMSSGDAAGVSKLLTDDALLIHPLLHRGGYGYGPFNETIQVRGANTIMRLLKVALPVLPDGAKSQLSNVVGGASGGGYEWRAGGDYADKGFDRKGICGATSVSIFRGKIQRVSVKFDTMQMTGPVRDTVRKLLADSLLG